MTTVAALNAEVFDGRLSASVMQHLAALDQERPEAQAFVARAFRLMGRARFRAEDVSPFFGWALGVIVPRALPGAWGGVVPPITADRRHLRIDEYVEQAFPGSARLFLDVGCGFPPLTTLNTAERFPEWAVTGADPNFDRYLVYDASGDYAIFDANLTLRYFQAAVPEPARWDALLRDPAATRERFERLLHQLRPLLPGTDERGFSWTEHQGARLERNPVLRWVRPNLSFVRAGLLARELPAENYDVVRCMNVLPYFDGTYRRHARAWAAERLKEGGLFIEGMDWPRTTAARYFVSRRRAGRLHTVEFALSLDNLRPLALATIFTLHDDDPEISALSRVTGLLRSDPAFREPFDAAVDRLLRGERLFRRERDGYLSDLLEERPVPEREVAFEKVERGLVAEGFVERAVEALGRAGLRAWRNPVGHLAVAPEAVAEAA
jgi:SAM-dependent methyltransferase